MKTEMTFGKVGKHYIIMINPLLKFSCLINITTFIPMGVQNRAYEGKFYFAGLLKNWIFCFFFTDVHGFTLSKIIP